MSNDIKTLLKVATAHQRLLNLMSLQLADQACLIEHHLPKCSRCEHNIATVEHLTSKVRVCDKCAARVIVASSREYVEGCAANPDDPINVAKSSLMNENDWVDMPDAEKIRRLMDYVDIIKELEVTPEGLH